MDEGEELGIYTWLFFMEEERQGIWSLIEEHPDSAFVLFCESYILTTDFMNRVSEFNNVMLMVEYHASASEICMQLRNRHLLYGVYYRYSAEDMNYIENGDIWREMQQLHPVFSVLIAASDCAPMIQKEIYDYVLKARESQKYATIPWEWYFDHCYIDNIISEETCFMHFDQEGDLPAGSRILFHQSLKQILEMHFRKKTQKCDKK